MPAVSTRPRRMPSRSIVSRSMSRVVPGPGATIARSVPTSWLNSDDLPTLGLPRIAMWRPSRMTRPRAASRAARRCRRARARSAGARLAGRDEVIALVGEIHRRLEARRQIEQLPIERADGPRERALELIERHARLQRRDGVDEVRHRFRLHEIEAAVQEGAKRELARLGKPRAGGDGRAHDLAQQRQAAVGADLDDILGGVGMRSREVGGDDFVDARDSGLAEPALRPASADRAGFGIAGFGIQACELPSPERASPSRGGARDRAARSGSRAPPRARAGR